MILDKPRHVSEDMKRLMNVTRKADVRGSSAYDVSDGGRTFRKVLDPVADQEVLQMTGTLDGDRVASMTLGCARPGGMFDFIRGSIDMKYNPQSAGRTTWRWNDRTLIHADYDGAGLFTLEVEYIDGGL